MAPQEAARTEDTIEYEFDPKLDEELLKHPGKWVATTRTELLAVGDSAAEVYATAKAGGEENPVIFRVPDDDDTHYFF